MRIGACRLEVSCRVFEKPGRGRKLGGWLRDSRALGTLTLLYVRVSVLGPEEEAYVYISYVQGNLAGGQFRLFVYHKAATYPLRTTC